MGQAELDIHDPDSVFRYAVRARGDGRTGDGVLWISHHHGAQFSWLVAAVTCVRGTGSTAAVTAKVIDSRDMPIAAPGVPIAFTVRDNGTKDRISVTFGQSVHRCDTATGDEAEISRGDFQVRRDRRCDADTPGHRPAFRR
ncbi:hypothetical protein D5S17_10675 [Pseudonocardiaceae bacterium YIM PH 21723]|nr:hypothetical protein D5S17_10675 [Pseudonocardiaceae bacterium YIM PH 21723]